MILKPPPDVKSVDFQKWVDELYNFIKKPTFEFMRMNPRSAAPTDDSEGVIYYDSDDHKLKVKDNNSWEDTY